MRITMILAALTLAACQPATNPVMATMQVAPAAMVTPTVQGAVPAGSMAALLNQQRTAQGRGAVSEDANLTRAAQMHADDMAANDYFSHTGLNGSRFTQRAQAAGYGCAIAENIAFGQRSEAEVVSVWMQSSGHRRNILQGNATEFGIGRAGNIWVLVMGRGC